MKKILALGLLTAACLKADQQDINFARTYLRTETPFQTASPERVSLFVTEDFRTKHRAAHNGDVQFAVFGGANTNQANAAAYYMPGGAQTVTFDASIADTAQSYWSGVQGGQARYAVFNTTAPVGNAPANVALGVSTGSSHAGTMLSQGTGTGGSSTLDVGTGAGTANAILNAGSMNQTPTAANQFVIGTGSSNNYSTYDLTKLRAVVNDDTTNGNFAAVGDMVVDTNKNVALVRPWNFGVGYAPNVQFGNGIDSSSFVSTITPEFSRSQWGIGATWKQMLSTKDTGFWLELSTALQRVQTNMQLNEVVTTPLTLASDENSTWAQSWSTQGYDASTAPQNITQAFAQESWNYGKVDGAQSVTRLADIELKAGYQFICTDQVLSNMFVGLVIPTGNKAQGVYMGEPIVGNGFHFGLMIGSTQEIQWTAGDDTRWSLRSDGQFRYLFKNTQVRSFDTYSNGQWSRYMMVWENYETEQANGELLTNEDSLRAYTPGINVFTREMNVTPRAQARMNQAVVVEHGSFKGEFGWNMFVRQSEQVSLATPWQDNSVAFVDASNTNTSLFNISRTIYNDAYQSTPLTNGGNGGEGVAGESQAQYNAASISAQDLNLGSAASGACFTNTPYLAVGYAFNEEKSSVFSLGASYEMSATNNTLNNWMLWGKFAFTF